MAKFNVTLEKILQKTYYVTIEVQAESRDDAEQKALDHAEGMALGLTQWAHGGDAEERPTIFDVEEVNQ